MVDIRVRFSKHGALRYIGHLDVMRYFQKVIRRTELDVAYTQGFSPHQIMTFAQPLGVGVESDGEYMDLRLNTFTSCDDIKDRINKHSVPEIQALSVKVLPEKSGNAMASVAAAEYLIDFKSGRAPKFYQDGNIPRTLNDFMGQEEIILVKEGKAGLRSIDIKDRIFLLEYDETEKCIHAILDASSGYNIKPIALMELISNFKNEKLIDNSLMVYRVDTYTRDEAGELLSMGLIGSEQINSNQE